MTQNPASDLNYRQAPTTADLPSAYHNTIVHGDALTVMRRLPAGSVDLVVTSPPYNLRNSTGNGLCASNGKSGKWAAALRQGYDRHADNLPHAQYVAWQRQCLAEML